MYYLRTNPTGSNGKFQKLTQTQKLIDYLKNKYQIFKLKKKGRLHTYLEHPVKAFSVRHVVEQIFKLSSPHRLLVCKILINE